nr:hypothetical protein Iba_chr08fCG5040 [Ipomoea batatas]
MLDSWSLAGSDLACRRNASTGQVGEKARAGQFSDSRAVDTRARSSVSVSQREEPGIPGPQGWNTSASSMDFLAISGIWRYTPKIKKVGDAISTACFASPSAIYMKIVRSVVERRSNPISNPPFALPLPVWLFVLRGSALPLKGFSSCLAIDLLVSNPVIHDSSRLHLLFLGQCPVAGTRPSLAATSYVQPLKIISNNLLVLSDDAQNSDAKAYLTICTLLITESYIDERGQKGLVCTANRNCTPVSVSVGFKRHRRSGCCLISSRIRESTEGEFEGFIYLVSVNDKSQALGFSTSAADAASRSIGSSQQFSTQQSTPLASVADATNRPADRTYRTSLLLPAVASHRCRRFQPPQQSSTQQHHSSRVSRRETTAAVHRRRSFPPLPPLPAPATELERRLPQLQQARLQFLSLNAIAPAVLLLHLQYNEDCQDLLWMGSEPFRTLLSLARFGSNDVLFAGSFCCLLSVFFNPVIRA